MGHWNYRVVKHRAKSGEIYHVIHEAYYNSKNELNALSLEPMYACGETKAELKRDMAMMLEAFKKPTLVFDKIKYAKRD
jgi:hypothetical protein